MPGRQFTPKAKPPLVPKAGRGERGMSGAKDGA